MIYSIRDLYPEFINNSNNEKINNPLKVVKVGLPWWDSG